MLEIGSIVDGKYKILNKIGQGGMSVVYLAMNEKANKQWAIKEIRKDGKQDFEVVRQGLIVETDMLKRLSHPHLPSIVDVIDEEDTFLIVMDYIEGNPLSNLLEEEGAQSQEDTVYWAKQLCGVLNYLHSQDSPIIYRDMKPANVMLKPDGNVTLIDFGIAREYKEGRIEDTTCLGTQGYAAPEQFGGKGQTDARTDIYCLGATMYHLVTGHNPAKPPYEMYPIRHWNENLSTGLEEIILKCTKKNPEDRYQNCNELMYALEHYDELDIEYQKKQKNKFAAFAGAALLGLCLMGVSVFGYVKENDLREHTYDSYIEMTERVNTDDEFKEQIMQAIALNPTKADAYIKLLDYFRADELFNAETEEPYLRQILNSVGANGITNSQSMEQDAKGFAEFAYKLGAAYWYEYGTKSGDAVSYTSQKAQATSWFKAVKLIETSKENNAKNYNNAQIYSKIGDYYEKLNQEDKMGDSQVTYLDFWNDLKELYTSEVTSDKTRLYVYKDIITSISNYAYKFQEDGVSAQEVSTMITDIKGALSNMTIDNNSKNLYNAVVSNVENAQRAYEAAYEKLTTTTEEGGQ